MYSTYSTLVRIALTLKVCAVLVSGCSDSTPSDLFVVVEPTTVTNDGTPDNTGNGVTENTTDGSGNSELENATSGTTDGDATDNINHPDQGIPEQVISSSQLVADKTIRIRWQPALGANFYRVLENADGLSGFTQISDDLGSSTQVFDHRITLYKRVNARYIVQACNAAGCVDSEELIISGSLVNAIGYFKASDANTDDNFGESVALNADGSVLAVGANEKYNSATGNEGDENDNSADYTQAVYVFVRSNTIDGAGDRWEQQAIIKSSNPGHRDFFGKDISLSSDGNTLAVGGVNKTSLVTGTNGVQSTYSPVDSGAVYVYTNTNGNWQRQAYLIASNADTYDGFGGDVELSGDGNTLVVSASGEDSNATGVNGDQRDNSAADAGAVYEFTRVNAIDGTGASWQQTAYLKASNAEYDDRFGRALGLSADGNTLAVGAYAEDSSATGIDGDQSDNSIAAAGAVYVFQKIAGIWQQQSYLKAGNSDEDDIFGARLFLAANGKTLAVTAIGEDSAATGINGNQNDNAFSSSGAVYVFENSGGEWQQQAYVKPSNGEARDYFGESVSLSGDGNIMVVGALEEDSAAQGLNGNEINNDLTDSGAAYVFERSNGNWQQRAYLKAINPEEDLHYGIAISLSTDGNTLAIGAPRENNTPTVINGDQNAGWLENSGAVYLY